MYTMEDPSAGYQMAPRVSRSVNNTNGLDCLRTTDSLYIKQQVSLTEGKLFQNMKIIFNLY